VLKSIATGEYRTELAKADMVSEGGPVEPVEVTETAAETESAPAEASTETTPADEAQEKSE
jgi:hypothetical protein